MRSAQRIRLLASLLIIITWSSLFAYSSAVRIDESEISAVISETEIALIASVSNESGPSPGRFTLIFLIPETLLSRHPKPPSLSNLAAM
jgi:hypothetical protein